MTKKKTTDNIYDESIEMQQFRQLLREKGYYQPHNQDQKRFTLEAPDRIYKKVLKRVGKYTIATAIMFLVASSWKKLISTLFGKVTVITVTTTVTVTSGYYVKKIILDKPAPEKKIEIIKEKQPEQTIIKKPVWRFAFKKLELITTGLDLKDKTGIEQLFYNTLAVPVKKHHDQTLTVTISYIESFYSVGLEIYEQATPLHKKTLYVANTEAKDVSEVFAFCKKQTSIIYEKYVK